MDCGTNMCGRCHGSKKIVFGALLLLNAFVWPLWVDLTGWIAWVAVLMVLGGIIILFKPYGCGHCSTSGSMSAPKKKK